MRCAKLEYGLRLVIGNVVPHLNFTQDGQWDGKSFRDLSREVARGKDGAISATRVAALMPTSIVSIMRRETGLPSRQLEIARSLRLPPAICTSAATLRHRKWAYILASNCAA